MCSFHPSCLQTLETLLLSENISVGSVGQFPTPLCWSPFSASATPFEREFCIKCKSPEQPSCPTSHPWHAPQPPWIICQSFLIGYSLKASGVWHVCDAHCCILTCGCFLLMSVFVEVYHLRMQRFLLDLECRETPSPKLKLEAILHLINATSPSYQQHFAALFHSMCLYLMLEYHPHVDSTQWFLRMLS